MASVRVGAHGQSRVLRGAAPAAVASPAHRRALHRPRAVPGAGETLVWDRAFGRPANAMVLPAEWALANSSVPATVSKTGDGRVRLDFLNPRNDEVGVVVTGVRR